MSAEETQRIGCECSSLQRAIPPATVAISTVADGPGSTFTITALVANRTYPKGPLHPIEFLRGAFRVEDEGARAPYLNRRRA
jgi:hypothetical protein